MTKRIFRSILGVSLAVLLASLVLIVGVLHGYFQDRVSGELESLAEYIAHGVEENGTDYLTEDLPGSYRITWVDADGTVLFDNRQDPEEMGNHAQREEIREALILGKGHAVRYSGHAFPADVCMRPSGLPTERCWRVGPGVHVVRPSVVVRTSRRVVDAGRGGVVVVRASRRPVPLLVRRRRARPVGPDGEHVRG